MIDLTHSWFEGTKIRNMDDADYLCQRTNNRHGEIRTTDMGELNTGNNRLLCEVVCMRERERERETPQSAHIYDGSCMSSRP